MATDDLDAIDKMQPLKDIGEPLGLTFPAGTSKENAKKQIREARLKAADTDPGPDGASTPPDAQEDGGTPPGTDDDTSTAPDHEPGDVVPIERSTSVAWWCPLCDHAQTLAGHARCVGCGAERDDDHVIVPDR